MSEKAQRGFALGKRNSRDKPARGKKAYHSGSDSDDGEQAEISIDIRQTKEEPQRKKKKSNPASKVQPNSSAGLKIASDDEDELIDVEFGLWDPLVDDDLTFRALLKDLIPDHIAINTKGNDESGKQTGGFALHEFCGILSNQAVIGTTLKADGTDEPLGLLTAIPISEHKSKLSLRQFYSYCSSHLPAAEKASFERDFHASSTGLMVSTRLVNTPHQLIHPLHSALLADIEWAVTQNEIAKPFDRFILLARCFAQPDASMRRQKSSQHQSWAYYRFEEEMMCAAAKWSARWSVPLPQRKDDEAGSDNDRLPQGAVLMCIDREDYQKVVDQLKIYNKAD